MSIQFHSEIFSNENIVLKVNFTGIKDAVVTTDNLAMSLYAYDKRTASPVFSATLNFDQIKILYEHLNQISIIKDPHKLTTGKFIEATDSLHKVIGEVTINAESLRTILRLLSTDFNANDRIAILLESLDDLDLENLPAAHKHKTYKTEIDNLAQLLSFEEQGDIVRIVAETPHLINYVARQPEAIFQKWITRNLLWIFGVEYIGHKKDGRKISIFSEADLVMESMDGFIDLIELKRPEHAIFNFDNSHNCYYPSVELAKALGQCGHYLKELDLYKSQYQIEHKVKVLRPRIKIIIGRTDKFNDEQFEALRMLNCNLSHAEIVSYDYLLSCGNHILSNYKLE